VIKLNRKLWNLRASKAEKKTAAPKSKEAEEPAQTEEETTLLQKIRKQLLVITLVSVAITQQNQRVKKLFNQIEEVVLRGHQLQVVQAMKKQKSQLQNLLNPSLAIEKIASTQNQLVQMLGRQALMGKYKLATLFKM